MNDRIAEALGRLFDQHRVVFWYDAQKELRADYEAVDMPGITKLEIAGNEYGLKYRILREEPQQKFLLYHEGPQPENMDNWLLDVLLAHGQFSTDQVTMLLTELELGPEFADVVQEHLEFFRAAKRKEALRKLMESDDTKERLRLKMLAVCAGSDVRMDSVVECLLQELATGGEEKFRLMSRCCLESFFWNQMQHCYGYDATQPNEKGLRDFVIELFKSCYAMSLGGDVKLSNDALVFLKRWKDSRAFETSFEALSKECAEALDIEHDLAKRDFNSLLKLDYFRLIDQKILSDLVRVVAARTVPCADVTLWVRQRRESRWYRDFAHVYEAVEQAALFLHTLGEARLVMESLSEGVQRYAAFWYQIDQLYRKFIYHVRKSGQASLMDGLQEQIENLYSNAFLLKLSDRFQELVTAAPLWEATPILRQDAFYGHWVQPFVSKENKVCVIISDAMRYEIGEELARRIRQEDRYTADIEPLLSMLPSYTQLGMAALLPRAPGQALEITANDTGTVLLGGQSTQGLANRNKILEEALPGRATACKADDLLTMKGEGCRALVRDNDVLYVYHNGIDSVGDKRESEERVFEAAEDSLNDLTRLIKKLNSANLYNFVVTADHGFIYQNRAIDESDFCGTDSEGQHILFRDRRFVIGKGLADLPSLHKFSSSQLGLASFPNAVEVHIPKSINRLRLKGSGSRFVHGGASLQEVVVPVVRINKKRQSDTSMVDVEILRGTNSIITSGQLAVTLYQIGPVTDKIQARVLRAGIYTEAGELISDTHNLTFDRKSENPREREMQVRFVLTRKADAANNQEVILKLEERHAGTSHFKDYKSLRYIMRRSFTSDFDL